MGEASKTEAENKNAFKKLRRAVGDKVIEQSDKIAESLVQSTLKGNSNSARIVVGLVGKQRKNKSKLEKLKKAAVQGGPDHCTAYDLAIDVRLPSDGGDMSLGDPDALRRKGRNADEAPK